MGVNCLQSISYAGDRNSSSIRSIFDDLYVLFDVLCNSSLCTNNLCAHGGDGPSERELRKGVFKDKEVLSWFRNRGDTSEDTTKVRSNSERGELGRIGIYHSNN